MSGIQTRAYRKGLLDSESFPLGEVSDFLASPGVTVWIDLVTPSVDVLHQLAAELGLHELAVEDALSDHQRPKLDHYESHLFLSAHAVRLDVTTRRLDTTEVDAFINPRWLVTVRKSDAFSLDHVVDRAHRSSDLADDSVGLLLHSLLDVIVDGYFNAIDAFDSYYDTVSESILSEHALEPTRQREWFELRQALVRFHRLVVPMREAISSLMRRDNGTITDHLVPYFQDVYDHVLRVTESTDALRDLVATLVETSLSLRDYRQNLVTKKITAWAAIIAVPTLITGWYGMNVPYPGYDEVWGVWASGGLVVTFSVILYMIFRRRDWL